MIARQDGGFLPQVDAGRRMAGCKLLAEARLDDRHPYIMSPVMPISPDTAPPQEQMLRNAAIAAVSAALILGFAVGLTNIVLPPHQQPMEQAPDPARQAALAAQRAAAAREEQTRKAALLQRQEDEQRMEQEARQRSDAKLQEALATRERALQSVREEKEQKEAAWNRFYKPLKKCVNANDSNLVFECSNHYLREQQRFERLWADGKLHEAD